MELGAAVSGLQWVLDGYMLALASLILLAVSLGDRFGRRRVFVVGVAWFAGASLLCAVAQDVGQLAMARVLQGIGAALLTPGSPTLIQASFVAEDRGRAIGAWSGSSRSRRSCWSNVGHRTRCCRWTSSSHGSSHGPTW